MLRSALALLSSLQIGARIKEAVERSLRQAILIALAVAVLIGSAAFGLIAAYYALISIYQFSPLAAAGLIAVSLLVVGLLIHILIKQGGSILSSKYGYRYPSRTV